MLPPPNLAEVYVNINSLTRPASYPTAAGDPYAGYGGLNGYYTHWETGLQLCGLRYYDSAAGRWLNRDPISYAGGVNVYEYCGNGPVGMRDASGLEEDGPSSTLKMLMSCFSALAQLFAGTAKVSPCIEATICKAIASCVNGLLCSALGIAMKFNPEVPGTLVASCIIGAGCAIMNWMLKSLCAAESPCRVQIPNLCDLLVRAAGGCINGMLSGWYAFFLRPLLSSVVGYIDRSCPHGKAGHPSAW